MQLDDFDQRFATAFEMKDVETIGGLVLNKFGELPGEGDCVVIDDYKFTVSRVAQNRITKLHFEPPSTNNAAAEDEQPTPEKPEVPVPDVKKLMNQTD